MPQQNRTILCICFAWGKVCTYIVFQEQQEKKSLSPGKGIIPSQEKDTSARKCLSHSSESTTGDHLGGKTDSSNH